MPWKYIIYANLVLSVRFICIMFNVLLLFVYENFHIFSRNVGLLPQGYREARSKTRTQNSGQFSERNPPTGVVCSVHVN